MAEEEKNPQQLATTEPDAAAEAPVEVLSAKRKVALLWYLGVLFLVAFLFVAISLVIQMRDSRSTISELTQNNSSALANVEKLQQQNRELQERAQQSSDAVEAQQAQIDDLTGQLEQKEAAIESLQNQIDALKQDLEDTSLLDDKTIRVYEALITALTCQTHEGNVTYSRAIESVEAGKELLSERALAVYETLINE